MHPDVFPFFCVLSFMHHEHSQTENDFAEITAKLNRFGIILLYFLHKSPARKRPVMAGTLGSIKCCRVRFG